MGLDLWTQSSYSLDPKFPISGPRSPNRWTETGHLSCVLLFQRLLRGARFSHRLQEVEANLRPVAPLPAVPIKVPEKDAEPFNEFIILQACIAESLQLVRHVL